MAARVAPASPPRTYGHCSGEGMSTWRKQSSYVWTGAHPLWTVARSHGRSVTVLTVA